MRIASGRKADRVCLVNSPTSPPAPTTPSPTSSPQGGGSCEPAGVSCTDPWVNCCLGCSGGKPSSRVCL